MAVIGPSRSFGRIRCPRGKRYLHYLAVAEVEVQRTLGDARQIGAIVTGSIGVGPGMECRLHRTQREVVTTLEIETDTVLEGHIARHTARRIRDQWRNVDQLTLHARHPAEAITLNSTAMGVGKARTSTVVRVAPIFAKCLA